MSTKHTPGPWIADTSPDKQKRGYVRAKTGSVVGRASSAQRGHSETCANAQLMAAAPDLLTALERIAKIDSDLIGIWTWKDITVYAQKIAREAIAKATGAENDDCQCGHAERFHDSEGQNCDSCGCESYCPA